MWNLIVGNEEKIIFEQWRLPVKVHARTRHASAAENTREEVDLQRLASQQVEKALHFVMNRANAKVDHLPPAPQNQASYKFEITFASTDGKGLSSSPNSLLPQ